MKEKYSIIRSADRYIELRQYKKAIKVYQSVIDSGENDPSVINNLGDLQFRNGDRESALKNYALAANIYSESGDALKALGICRKLLRIDPSNDATLNLILDLNQRREATFDSKGILSDLVNTAVNEKNFSRAAFLQEKLIGLGERDPVSQVLLSEFSFMAGNKDQAVESLHHALDFTSTGADEPDGWEWITELLASRDCPEGFQQFVMELETGYVPLDADTESRHDITLPAVEPPPPVGDESLISPEFFEVDGSVGLDEKLQEDSQEVIESAADVSPDFDSGQAEKVEAGKESAAFDTGEENDIGEELGAQEFEFNLDEGDLSRSPEEFMEMLKSGIESQEDFEESLDDEPAEAVAESAEEEESFELDLDKEDLSLDYEALDIEDLGEPVVADSEMVIPETDEDELVWEAEKAESGIETQEDFGESLDDEPAATVAESAEEEESFELDLDKEDLSLDYEALGIEDLGEPDDADSEMVIPETDEDELVWEAEKAESGIETQEDFGESLDDEPAEAVAESAEEEESFELDLDKEDLSLDYEALGIEDLGEPDDADSERDIFESGRDFGTEPGKEQDFIPAELQETGKIAAVPGDYDEVESALEGLFVLDGQADNQPSDLVPEGIPELEYPVDSRAGLSMDAPGPDSDEDPEVQFELGIAYRDMALMEDAIGKFKNALLIFEGKDEKDRCVLCCQLLAECCNKVDLFRETLKWVARGLDYRKVSEDEIVNFEYESAVALEALGDYSESLRGLRRIQSIHPGFRDVESRISAMESAEH